MDLERRDDLGSCLVKGKASSAINDCLVVDHTGVDDQGTCEEEARLPIVAENGPRSRGSPVQEGEEVKENATRVSFRKTIRNYKCLTAMEVPATFVKKHGHKFKSIVSIESPSSRATNVELRIKSYSVQHRVFFAGEVWREFVRENGFKVGHQLHFTLVSMSSFTVRLVETPEFPATAKIQRHSSQSTVQQILSNYVVRTPKASTSSPNRPELGPKEKVSLPSNVKNDVVYGQRTLEFKRQVESCLENLRCPHFVTMVRKSNLREERSSALSVPAEFQKKYGTYFSKFNSLQGPSGRWMEVCFSGTSFDRFAKGWKSFHKENGIKLGDVLLFSLRAPACWLVQVVETARLSEETTTGGELCDMDESK